MDTTLFRVITTVIAVFGVGVGIALLAGLGRAASRSRAATGLAPTRAVVVENQTHAWGEGRLSFSPVVRYRDPTGAERTAAARDTSPSSWVTGTDLDVLVDPDQPGQVMLAGGRARNARRFGAGFSGLVGVVFIAVGIGAWIGLGQAVAGGAWWAGPFGNPTDGVEQQVPFGP